MKRPLRTSKRMPLLLTPLQREVLELRVLGLSWPAIAKKMRLAPTTVRQHYAYAMEKSRRRFGRQRLDKKELRK